MRSSDARVSSSPPFRSSRTLLAAALVLGALTLLGSPAWAQTDQSVYENGRFEIGDGVNPPVPGMADVEGNLLQDGPDWSDLFDSLRNGKDVYDELGTPDSPNGVPDFLDIFGGFRSRRDVSFISDDVVSRDDLGEPTGTDSSVLSSSGTVVPGVVDAAHDLGNAYAYAVFDGEFRLVLYAGIERLVSGGAATLELEFNQSGFYVAGEEIRGERSIGDVRVVVDLADALAGVSFQAWGLRADGSSGWLPPIQIAGEDCDPTGTACAVCNAETVASGEWTSYDASGTPVASLAPGTLFEIGVNVGSLLGADTGDIRFQSFQITSKLTDGTAQDYAIGYFERATFGRR